MDTGVFGLFFMIAFGFGVLAVISVALAPIVRAIRERRRPRQWSPDMPVWNPEPPKD